MLTRAVCVVLVRTNNSKELAIWVFFGRLLFPLGGGVGSFTYLRSVNEPIWTGQRRLSDGDEQGWLTAHVDLDLTVPGQDYKVIERPRLLHPPHPLTDAVWAVTSTTHSILE